MKRLITAILCAAASFAASAIETSDVDYGQTSASSQLSLIWEFEEIVYNDQICAVITGVKNSGGKTVSGDIATPETVTVSDADGNATSYIVKKIVANTFRNQIGISSVTIPRTVQDIDPPFCIGCSLLSRIDVAEDNPWFTGRNGLLLDKDMETLVACPATLDEVQLPSTLTTIGADAFNGCFRLKNISIPAGVTEIGDNAFANCRKLKSVTFNGNAPSVGTGIFSGTTTTVYVPDGISSFGSVPGTWQGQTLERTSGGVITGVTSATDGNVTWFFRVVDGQAELYNNGQSCIGNGVAQTYTWDKTNAEWVSDGELRIPSTLGGYPVTRIGENAFRDCTALVKVAIPESIVMIGDYAFRNCSGVKTLDIPESVKSIGYHPFENSSLTALALPDSLQSLDGNPMAGCSTVLTVSINGNNSFFAVANGLLYDKDVALLIGCPARHEGTTIAPTCVAIGPEAFYGCFRASGLIIPEHVAFIGDSAFNDMPRLASLVFPASVGEIEGAGLFAGCPNLEFVGFSGNAPAVDPEVFFGTPETLKIYVNQDTRGWNGDPSSSALPADGKWPLTGDNRRAIENLNVSAEADLKEGDVFTLINTNGTMYAWTMKVLANKGLEIIAVSPKPTGSFTVPNEFESVLGTMTVKSIGDRLFANSTGLLAVTIPNSVTNIGDEVFLNCDVLSSVSLNYGLRSIGRHPFSGSAVGSVTLPDTVNSIDGNILAGCDPSTGINVSGTNPHFAVSDQGSLYDKDFTTLFAVPMTVEEIEIPASVTDFAEECFLNCIRLKKVTFLGNAPTAADGDDLYLDAHSSMTNFVTTGNTTFGALPGTWHLRPVVANGSIGPEQEDPVGRQEYTDEDGNIWLYTIEDGKAELGHWGSTPVLKNPDAEGTVSVPETLGGYPLSSIPDRAFENCRNISCIEIPATIDSIGDGAFNGCSALEEIKVSGSNPNYRSRYGALYTKDGTTLIKVPAKFEFDWTMIKTTTSAEMTWRIMSQYFETVGDALVLRPATTNVLHIGSESTKTETVDNQALVSQETLFSGVSMISDYAFTDCGAVPVPADTRDVKVITAVATVIGDNTAVEQTVVDTITSYSVYEPLRIPSTVTVIGTHATDGSLFTDIGNQNTARFFVKSPAAESSITIDGNADEGELPTTAPKTTYGGWTSTDGVPYGVITAKTNAKNKLSGSLLMLGAKKKTIKSIDALAEYGDVFLGEVYNGFKNKVWTLVFATADNGGDPMLNGFTVLSVAVKTKGKVNITGYAADGTKISSSSQLVKIGNNVFLPMVIQLYTGKKGGFAVLCRISGEKLSVESHSQFFTKKTSAEIITAAIGTPMNIDIGDPVCELPYGFAFPDNFIWRPRYTKKSGIITGSYKLLDSNGRKKTTKVYGVSIDGNGYATSVITKTVSMPTVFSE